MLNIFQQAYMAEVRHAGTAVAQPSVPHLTHEALWGSGNLPLHCQSVAQTLQSENPLPGGQR